MPLKSIINIPQATLIWLPSTTASQPLDNALQLSGAKLPVSLGFRGLSRSMLHASKYFFYLEILTEHEHILLVHILLLRDWQPKNSIKKIHLRIIVSSKNYNWYV